MKKMRGILSFVIAMMVITTLVGCGGGGEATGYEGKYVSVSGEMMGITLTGEDISGWSIELDNGGKGEMEVEGESANIKWSLEGESLNVTVEGEEITGTIEGDNLVFDNLFNTGMKITFAKESTTAVE